ncbi:MAG: phosphoribosylglycinamide formyltransferase [Pseudomonadota bacterium]
MKARLAILISGRGSNMRAIVEACQEGILTPLAEAVIVLCNKPGAAGLEVARQAGVPAVVVPSKGKSREAFEQQLLATLQPLRIDLVVLAGFMRVLTPLFVHAYPQRIINIHPADTRAYQGAHAYTWAHENKLTTTWITVHRVDDGVDTGEVLGRAEVDLRGAVDLEEIQRRGLEVEHRLYPEVLRQLLSGGRMTRATALATESLRTR